jgi:hypothetical protein
MKRLTFNHLPQPPDGPQLAVIWPAGDVTSFRDGISTWFPSVATFAKRFGWTEDSLLRRPDDRPTLRAVPIDA